MLYTVRQQGLVTGYQHPRAILREFGHSDAKINAWMASGVCYDDSDS